MDTLVMDAVRVVEGLFTAFQQSEVTDIAWLLVDNQVLYLDTRELPGDLELAWVEAGLRGGLGHDLHELGMGLIQPSDGLSLFVLCRLQTRVPTGTDELVLRIGGRIPDLEVQPGESAQDWLQRVRVFARDSEALRIQRAQMMEFGETVGAHLAQALPEGRVHLQKPWVRIVVPPRETLGRLRALRFGKEVEGARYRPAPVVARSGLFDDPLLYIRYDPYYELLHWALLDTVVNDRIWRDPGVHLVHPGGTLICNGTEIDDHLDRLVPLIDLVSVEADRVLVHRSVPDAQEEGDVLHDEVWESARAF